MSRDSVLYRYRMEIILALILLISGVLNIWNIWTLGYTNSYYAAAVRSMLENPAVLFFNSFDAGGFVTVDKPPVGLWAQAAFAAVLGFSGWVLVLPQALAGVGSVALLYAIVSRPFGKPAGLVAAFALSITPIFVAVSRNQTPDGLLIFILLLAVWAALKAARENSLPFLLAAVTLAGIGFNIKMIQAFIVVPAILAVYFLGAKEVRIKNRVLHIALAVALLVVVSLSWAIAVDSVPPEDRPYIGGSGDNTVMGLIVNYNGIHRLDGDSQDRSGNSETFTDSDRTISRTAGDSGTGLTALRNQSAETDRQSASTDGSTVSSRQASQDTATTATGLQDTQVAGISQNQTKDAKRSAAVNTGNTPGRDSTSRQVDGQSGNDRGTAPTSGSSRTGGGGEDKGTPGPLRLFGEGLAGQIAWLLPFALLGLLAWIRRPAEWSLKGLDDAGYFSEKAMVILAMCLWLLPGLAYFSFTTGHWHVYYIATIAPPLAALAGIGVLGLHNAFTGDGMRRWLLPTVIAIAGAVELAILLITDWPEVLVPVIAIGCTASAILLAALVLKDRTRSGRLPLIAVALAIGILFIAPFIWACTPLAYGSGGSVPLAGPSQSRGSGATPGGNIGSESADSPDSLTQYLISHQEGERWIVAVPSSRSATDIIISTGAPVMALGGFSGSDKILTTESLKELINSGEIRYFLLSGDGGGGTGGGSVSSWVSSNCAVVPSSEYAGGSAGGISGDNTLFDCEDAADN